MKTGIDDITNNFKPITFDDFDVINDFFKKYPFENCDYNLCNLFSWGMFLKMEYTIYSGRLIFFNPFYSYLLSPIGEKLSAEELFQINSSFKKANKDIEFFAVSEEYINDKNISEYFHIENDENLNNYIYTTEDLVKLPGKKLAKKKNLISQFNRLYPESSVKPMEKNDYDEIMDFCYYWRTTHEVGDEYIDIEFAAIKTILTHWDLFPCNGLKLYINGKICAFSVYSPQTADMATVHFEKYDVNIKGAGQAINHETAKVLINDYKYINREEDMGFAGIRQAKRSYQPLRMLPYYKLRSLDFSAQIKYFNTQIP